MHVLRVLLMLLTRVYTNFEEIFFGQIMHLTFPGFVSWRTLIRGPPPALNGQAR